ncbi:unnamed protein product [Caenorhabditis brenneri]
MQRQFFANNKSADLNNNKRASGNSKISANQWYPTSSTSQPGKKVVCNRFTNGIRDTKGVDLRYGANNMYCDCIKCYNEKIVMTSSTYAVLWR